MKASNVLKSSFQILTIFVLLNGVFLQACSTDGIDSIILTPTFKVVGRDLIDPCGDKVLLKGVNKMSVFDNQDIYGTGYFPEIAKTGANSVRIVWLASYDSPQQLAQLDSLIKNCMKQKMIPMVELHDATCNWEMLDEVVAFWVKPSVVQLVQKYQHALLVNIANEAGSDMEAITAPQFLTGYKDAITKIRNAGIKTPLFIDASDCGKNLAILVPTSAQLIQHDPDHNIMFSVHTYWSNRAIEDVQPTFIRDELQKAVDNNIPLILGELCAYGGWPGSNVKHLICSPQGAVNYQTLMAEAASRNMGWMVWEWGPGNGFYKADGYDPAVLCPEMDLTTDGTYNSVLAVTSNDPNAWSKDVLITNPLGVKNTAVKSAYLLNGFKCQ